MRRKQAVLRKYIKNHSGRPKVAVERALRTSTGLLQASTFRQ